MGERLCDVCGEACPLVDHWHMGGAPGEYEEAMAAHWRLGYERSQEALAAARRECEGLRTALRNIVGVWKEIHDDAKQRRMWILGWETWLKVIAEGAALAAPAAGDPK